MVFKTSLLTTLCLHSTIKVKNVTPGLLAKAPSPLELKAEELTWQGCGSNAEHNNCTFTTLKLPTFDVLKTGKDLGIVTALGAEWHTNCSGLNCYYGGTIQGLTFESAEHTAGAESGMLTANHLPIPKVKGFLCPNETYWTALYEPTKALWLRS